MSAWDIDPAGVRGVLGKTRGVAGEFSGELTRLSAALESASTGCSSGIVGSALAGFAGALKPQAESVLDRTSEAITGCTQAVNAYVSGDLEMAANAQRNAAGVVEPDLMRGPRGPRPR